ncbi:HNH endonuclease family protein [uncultured Polaribacter sp.]|uniref:HNH endonuclease family protein n=1 Tax=uncultured Polaribacter sp. TaxID=174711 RepID=UPI00262BFF6C|nr:HNH endonuclease family protein [uncultured Polaribacter sp.]
MTFRINWDEESLQGDFNNHHSSRISRVLLLLDAYLNPNQIELIPFTSDIEHIFPKKWQNTNYNGWDLEDANKYLDKLGNKVILEKKLNIQAGNGYFGIKKSKYFNSKIANIKDLATYPKDDWVKSDIEQREINLKQNIINFFITLL